MREIVSTITVVPCCTGSSRFSYNGTTVLCTIQGPSDNISRQEDSNKVILDVKWRDSTLINGRIYDKYFSGIMEKILNRCILVELDSYKTIQINFNIVGEARNTLFCAINAVFLALVDGGIPLRSMFYATSSFSHEEEVFVFNDNEVIFSHSFGSISEPNLKDAKAFLEYIKESQKYSLRPKLSFHTDY